MPTIEQTLTFMQKQTIHYRQTLKYYQEQVAERGVMAVQDQELHFSLSIAEYTHIWAQKIHSSLISLKGNPEKQEEFVTRWIKHLTNEIDLKLDHNNMSGDLATLHELRALYYLRKYLDQ